MQNQKALLIFTSISVLLDQTKFKLNTSRKTMDKEIVINAPRAIIQKGCTCLPSPSPSWTSWFCMPTFPACIFWTLTDFVSHHPFFWLHFFSEILLKLRQNTLEHSTRIGRILLITIEKLVKHLQISLNQTKPTSLQKYKDSFSALKEKVVKFTKSSRRL